MEFFKCIYGALRFMKAKLSEWYSRVMGKALSKWNAVSNLCRFDDCSRSRLYKVCLVFGDRKNDSHALSRFKEIRGFSPRNLFGKLFSGEKGSELEQFVFSQISALSIPKNATRAQTERWGKAVSDFLFEIYLLSKSGQLPDATRNEVINALKSEMKFRQMELVDSDEYEPSLHKVISSIPRVGASKITVKEKASYGIKICGVILKKQEVIIYNPSFDN